MCDVSLLMDMSQFGVPSSRVSSFGISVFRLHPISTTHILFQPDPTFSSYWKDDDGDPGRGWFSVTPDFLFLSCSFHGLDAMKLLSSWTNQGTELIADDTIAGDIIIFPLKTVSLQPLLFTKQGACAMLLPFYQDNNILLGVNTAHSRSRFKTGLHK